MVLAVLLLVVSSQAGWGPIAVEAGAGLVGGAFLGAGLATGGFWLGTTVTRSLAFEREAQTLCIAGGIAGVSFGTTIGTWLVGRACRQGGSCQWTLCGALAGTLVGVPAAVLGLSLPPASRWRPAATALVTLGALMPSTGTVLGYNLSRPKAASSAWFDRIDLPAVSLRLSGEGHDRPSLDVCLLSARL